MRFKRGDLLVHVRTTVIKFKFSGNLKQADFGIEICIKQLFNINFANDGI